MTPELAATIIACLSAIAEWFKSRTDVSAIRNDREATKAAPMFSHRLRTRFF